MQRRQTRLILTVIVLIFSIISVFFSDNSSKLISPNESIAPSLPPDQSWGRKEINSSSVEQEPSQANLEENGGVNIPSSPIQNDEHQAGYRVIKVVDGDTFDVDIDGKTERLRMIGIDTPEVVGPRKTVQCFGTEASNKAKEILSGKFVVLESGPSQGDRDKYGRLLRYAFLPDGTNFGLFMISEGYAYEYTYRYPYKYQNEFKQTEIEARNNNKGLWAEDTCSGIN